MNDKVHRQLFLLAEKEAADDIDGVAVVDCSGMVT